MDLFNQKRNTEKISEKDGNFFVAKIFSVFKKKKINKEKEVINTVDGYEDLDKKLVYSLSSHKIPNFKQIKYVRKVLSFKERMIIYFSLSVILLALLFFGFRFYKKNLEIIPEYGGVYSEALLGSPKNINPLYDLANDVDRDLSTLIFSSLFKRGIDGLLINDLVEKYEISEDGKEYRFKIKNNIYWHHEERLTVDDIVFTFEAIKNPEYGSPLRASFLGVEVEKIDEYNFKFILAEPYAAFLDMLVFGVLPQNLWSNIDPKNASLAELNLKPIGSGPYKFKSLTKNKSGEIKEMVLVANERYYDQVPYISSLNFKFFSYFEEMIDSLNNNLVDGISYLPHGLKDNLVSQNSLNFHKLNLPQIASLFFNQKSGEFLQSKDFRKALALSIDKNSLVTDIFSGNAGLAYGPILPNNFAYNDTIEKYNYNPEEAKKILDDLKWTTMNISEEEIVLIRELINLENNKVEKIDEETAASDEESESNQGESLESEEATSTDVSNNEALVLEYQEKLKQAREKVELIENWQLKKKIVSEVNRDNYEMSGTWRVKGSDYLSIKITTVNLSDNIDVANFIKSNWESIGIKTFIKVIDTNQVQTDILKNRDFEVLLLSQVVGNDPDLYLFWHSSQSGENGLNIVSYKNKEVDKLLEEARMSLNINERIEKYKKFQELLNNDLPAVFLYFPNYTYVQNKRIKGFDVSAISDPADRFSDITSWYIKIKRRINF